MSHSDQSRKLQHEAGWVSDVRIHPGQYVAHGDIVASMATDDTRATLLAVLAAAID